MVWHQGGKASPGRLYYLVIFLQSVLVDADVGKRFVVHGRACSL